MRSVWAAVLGLAAILCFAQPAGRIETKDWLDIGLFDGAMKFMSPVDLEETDGDGTMPPFFNATDKVTQTIYTAEEGGVTICAIKVESDGLLVNLEDFVAKSDTPAKHKKISFRKAMKGKWTCITGSIDNDDKSSMFLRMFFEDHHVYFFAIHRTDRTDSHQKEVMKEIQNSFVFDEKAVATNDAN